MGLFRLFDGARVRERYSLLAKDHPLVDKNRRYARSVGKLLPFGKSGLGKCWQKREQTVSFGPEDSHIADYCPLRSVFREEGWWKVSGKRAGRGETLPLHGVLLQVVGLILLKIPIEQSHGVSHAWLLANMLGVKKSHVAHRFRGREGHEGEAVCWHGCVFER